jgi:hypothetical protein
VVNALPRFRANQVPLGRFHKRSPGPLLPWATVPPTSSRESRLQPKWFTVAGSGRQNGREAKMGRCC